jgi:ribosomal protein S27E
MQGGSAMPSEELGRVLQIPVSCPHCPKYSDQQVAFVISSKKFTCRDCGDEIDLTTKEWSAFRRKFSEALKELQPLYKQLP